MRHQRAEYAATGAGADTTLVDQPDGHAGPCSRKGCPKPHDTAADDQNFAHRLTFSGGGIIAIA
ncbi:hypothetical protein D3C72_1667870 [compost metagenome]